MLSVGQILAVILNCCMVPVMPNCNVMARMQRKDMRVFSVNMLRIVDFGDVMLCSV